MNSAGDTRVMPESATVILPSPGTNLANSSDTGPIFVNTVSVCRTQESGESESLHNSASTRRPRPRDTQYQLLSAMADAATAAAMIEARLRCPVAVSAPATASNG